MGRECRRVPPDWVHPKRTDGRDGYQPMYGKGYHVERAMAMEESAETTQDKENERE